MATWRASGKGWEIRWYESGRRRSKTFYGSMREVKARAAALELAAAGKPRRDTPATLGDAVTAWAVRGGRRVSPLSQAATERRVRNWIVPHVGHLPLERVTHLTLEAFYEELAEQLAPATVRSIHFDISGALRLAVRDGLIPDSPAAKVRLAAGADREVRPPTVADLSAFLAEADATGRLADVEVALAVRIAIATGARLGEVCGLRWGDIDRGSCTVSVVRTVIAPRGDLQVKATKTKVRRLIAVPPALFDRLDDYRARKADLEVGGDTDYVLSCLQSVPLSPSALGNRFRRIRNGAGLSFRFHDLRHFTASAWVADMPPHAASRAIGHTQFSTTTDTYGHLLGADVDRRTAEAIARRINL